jgi:predicted dehydrogenase
MSGDAKLRFGVIGVSRGGGRSKACNTKHSELVAICDLNEELLGQVSEETGCERTFTDYERMLALDDLDAVFIATPDAAHEPMTVAGLDAGKHVLCEKPMAISMDQVHAMLAAEERSGCQLGINQVLRTNPRMIEAKRMADNGYLGELFYGEADYVHNISHLIIGGWRGELEQRHTPFIGGGCHMIDLLRWCMGEVVEVFAYGSHKCLTQEQYPFDDCNISVLKFASGACGKFGATYGCQRPSFRNFMLYGTEGTYVAGRDFDEVTVNDRPDSMIKVDIPVQGHPYAPVVEEFAAAVLAGERVPICGRDVANTIAIAIAGNESIESGEPVKPEYFEF